jgi:hypothetical protein
MLCDIAPEEGQELTEEQRKELKRADIKIRYAALAVQPVEIGGITFNGGADSAAAIGGSIQLDEAEGKTDTVIWDINNVNHAFTIEEGKQIAAVIGKAYRDIMYLRNEELNNVD